MGDWITGLGITHLLQALANAILARRTGRGSPRAWAAPGLRSGAEKWPGAGGGGRTCPHLPGWALLWEPSPSPDTLPWLAFKGRVQAHLLHPENNPFPAVCSSQVGKKTLQSFRPSRREVHESNQKPARGRVPSGALTCSRPSAGQGGLHPHGGIYPEPRKVSGSARGLSRVPLPNIPLLPQLFPPQPSSPAATPRCGNCRRDGGIRVISGPNFRL